MASETCARCTLAAGASIHADRTADGTPKHPMQWHVFQWPPLPCHSPACLACQDGRVEKCLRRIPRASVPR